MQPYSSIFRGKHLARLQCAFESSLHAILGWSGRDLKGHHMKCPLPCSEAHSVSTEIIICSIKSIRMLRGLIQTAGQWTHSIYGTDAVKTLQVTLDYSQDLETEALLLCNPVLLYFSLHQNHLEAVKHTVGPHPLEILI